MPLVEIEFWVRKFNVAAKQLALTHSPSPPTSMSSHYDATASSPAAKKARTQRPVRPEDPRDVCIVGVARTPCGLLQGKLSSVHVTDLAATAIRGASFFLISWR